MPRCGECENYRFYSAIGPIEGYCIISETAEAGAYKKVRFDTTAEACGDFSEMKSVETDTAQFGYRPDLRAYGEKKKV